MPLVRFGLQIASSDSDGQVAARLSAVVTPLYGDNELVSMQVSVAGDDATGAVEGTEVEVTGVSSLAGRVAISGFGGSETWNANIEASFDGSVWFDTGESVALQQASVESASFSFTGVELARFIRHNKTSSSAGGGSMVTIDYLGRSF